MRDKIGAAIIGATGQAGTGHLAGYEAAPGVEVRVMWAGYRGGDVGEVSLADGNYRSSLGGLKEKTPWRFDPKHPQDILLGGACHPLDTLRWLMDVTVEEVHGFSNHLSEPLYTIDDCYSVHCKFSNGAIGRLCAMSGARAHTPDNSGVSLWGTKGTI